MSIKEKTNALHLRRKSDKKKSKNLEARRWGDYGRLATEHFHIYTDAIKKVQDSSRNTAADLFYQKPDDAGK